MEDMELEYENVTGRIYDIQGYAVHDGPGIRTTVFTKGCPLHCLWCHSPESQGFGFELGWLDLKCLGMDLCGDACAKACSQGAITRGEPSKRMGTEEMVTKAAIDRSRCVGCLKCTEVCVTQALYVAGWDTTVDEVYDRLMKDVPFFTNDGGVTISGGEAMSQFPFTLNLVKRLKGSGIHICLDTTGFAPAEHFLEILPYVDLFLYDVKHMDSKRHQALTGVPNELILNNARLLAAHGAKLQIRYPVIPKLNDSWENMKATADFCLSLGEAVTLVQLLPYHKSGRSKYERLDRPYRLTNVEPPPESFMQEALELFVSKGLPAQIH
jgi:pyruvate formate lyase activating enzyme